jgi:hypothetical protein|tara:strand:+ start:719 stop:1288 length:570 start_codon:yes stop_codon:yes gene_type:complete
MPTAVQFRRGDQTQNDAFTGLAGEVAVDLTNNTLRIHDGTTQGGHEMLSGALLATKLAITTAASTYAPLASPALTGTPTAATAAQGTNSTQVATTAFVATEVNAVIAAAPAALDTLNELAAALGDDANYATTTTNAIAAKLTTPVITADATSITEILDDVNMNDRILTNPVGYMDITIGGVAYKVPYFA